MAQRLATKKLEVQRDQQLCNVDTPTPQTQPGLFNAQALALALPSLKRPLAVLGSIAQQNRIVNTNFGIVNIRDDPY